MIKLQYQNDDILLYSPYNGDVPKFARAAGGIWDASRKCWKFPKSFQSAVNELLRSQWYIDSPEELNDLIDVTIKANTDVTTRRRSVDFRGRTVAESSGRDSGARLGDGVAKVSGRATSSGSVKNWCTYVTKGSEFIVQGIPRAVAKRYMEREESKRTWTILDPVFLESEHIVVVKPTYEELVTLLRKVKEEFPDKEDVLYEEICLMVDRV